MPGTDRLITDIHPYVAFDEGSRADPIDVPAPDGQLGWIWPGIALKRWGKHFNKTSNPSVHGCLVRDVRPSLEARPLLQNMQLIGGAHTFAGRDGESLLQHSQHASPS